MRNSYKPSRMAFMNFTGILSSVSNSDKTYFTFNTSFSPNAERKSLRKDNASCNIMQLLQDFSASVPANLPYAPASENVQNAIQTSKNHLATLAKSVLDL